MNSPRFISIRTKFSIMVVALLLLVNGVAQFLSYQSLQALIERNNSARLQRLESVYRNLLERHAKHVQKEVAELGEGLDEVLAGKAAASSVGGFYAGLEDVLVFGFDTRLLYPAKGRPVDERQLSILARVSAQLEPETLVECASVCAFRSYIPIILGSGRKLIVSALSPMDDLMLDFRQMTGANIAFLNLRPQTTRPGALWDYSLMQATQKMAVADELARLSRNQPLPTLKTGLSEEHEGRVLLVKAVALAEAGRQGWPTALLLSDESENLREADANALRALLLSTLSMLLLAILLSVLIGRSISRLRKLARTLPLISEQRFAEAGAAIAKQQIHRRHYDEIDVLVDTSGQLSEQLAAMKQIEAAAQHHREAQIRAEARNEHLEEEVSQRTQALQRAVEAANRANEAKSDFLANMSHEIRSPMNAILGLAYLLKQQSLPPTADDMVAKINHAGVNLLGIINDILDFSKIEAQKFELEAAPFRLSEVLDSVANIMSASVGKKALEVAIDPAPKGANNLVGDSLRLSQVLINLVSNAIKFTAEGSVQMQTHLLAGNRDSGSVRLRFEVRDTGIGIAPDKQLEIFEAFTQADSSTTRSFGGTGLGLAISSRIVEQMGGELCLESRPGEGSRFWFEVEFAVADDMQPSIPELARQRVLIIDDQEVSRMALAATAQSLGWASDVLASGEEAVRRHIQQGQALDYDVILIDWKMPGLDGLATALALQAAYQHQPRLPKLIMATAYDRGELLAQPAARHVERVLTKPVTASALFNAVLELSPALAQREISRKQRRLESLRILVVDDSDTNLMVARNILSGEGAEVELADNGQAAIDILQARPAAFDIVLMDVQMPIMDGYAATRRIRQIPEIAGIPVIALTAGAFKIHREAALAAGMNDFIAKPFEVNALIRAILHWHAGIDEPSLAVPLPPPVPREAEILNYEQGLLRFADAATYARFLHGFCEQYRDAEMQVSGLEKDALGAWLHAMKGTAGNLALERLYAALKAAELVLADSGEAETLNLQPVWGALQEARLAIANDLPASPGMLLTPSAASGSAGGPALAAVEEGLRRAARQGDFEGAERALSQLAAAWPAERSQAAAMALHDFDFDRLLTLLDDPG